MIKSALLPAGYIIDNDDSTHEDETPYACDVEGCGQTLTRSHDLGRHRGFVPESAFVTVKHTAEDN